MTRRFTQKKTLNGAIRSAGRWDAWHASVKMAMSRHAVLPLPVGRSIAPGQQPSTARSAKRRCHEYGSWLCNSRKYASKCAMSRGVIAGLLSRVSAVHSHGSVRLPTRLAPQPVQRNGAIHGPVAVEHSSVWPGMMENRRPVRLLASDQPIPAPAVADA